MYTSDAFFIRGHPGIIRADNVWARPLKSLEMGYGSSCVSPECPDIAIGDDEIGTDGRSAHAHTTHDLTVLPKTSMGR